MMTAENVVGESSNHGKGTKRRREVGAKYARYTDEQIALLEKLYAECQNPSRIQRLQILNAHPVLKDIENRQLKIWFQNRRCREKQKKENSELLSENRSLIAANKLLRQEIDVCVKNMAQLVSENEHLRNQVLTLTAPTTATELSYEAEANSPQPSFMTADNNRGLLLLAEETKNEFLSKATGTAIDWIPVPLLKLPAPNSLGNVCISHACVGVAARAFTVVPFDPIKTMEILKDRPSWSRDCRNLEVLVNFSANNGGTIELVYTQFYAPTTLASARDFWTLRYTSIFEDGSLVVCEKSISGSDAGPSSPAALEFVRGRMLASGYLIRPFVGGRSTIHLVDHLDLEASSVPEVLRPVYKSSEFVAEKMTVSALHYIEHLANEMVDKQTHDFRNEPDIYRSFGQRLSRSFNDAVNGFTEDGWSLINADTSDYLLLSIKRTSLEAVTNHDSILCVKASLLLQSVSPAKLVRLLRESRSDWMNFNFDDHSVAFLKSASFVFPGSHTHDLSENAVLLGHTINENEILEIIRFERFAHRRRDVSPGILYHLQICNGKEDSGVGAFSELIFAPIDSAVPNDAILLSSGFRIFSLPSNTQDIGSTTRGNVHASTMLVLAFQFPFESHLQEEVVTMARQYVSHVITSVKNMSLAAIPSGSNPTMNSNEANPSMEPKVTLGSISAVNLANWISQSYRSSVGAELLSFNCQSSDSLSAQLWHHQYAILCFSFTSNPICLYANQTGLKMLETTPENLQTITVDKIFGDSNAVSLYSVIPTIMQQGYAILPPGHFLSVMNDCVPYEQAVVWRVNSPDASVHCLALAFTSWSSL
ncbi:Homeobox-leucine zipper protein REVOLUTA [Abeliophyllum distichum]|uniref:Homeobox-leucine zipper protein REVOLUTA n=1 Tax=Abeliophyllum distichum TaxID=126358 RepID=A0ABD1ULB3_9LAMI